MTTLELIKTYPTGGGYLWDATKPTSGVTMDLVYQGTTILKADKATYCCGLTFETWFRQQASKLTISVKEMKALQRDWYVASGKRKGVVDALVPRGLGSEIKGFENVLPGDYLQFWRKSGSGHSAVYIQHTFADFTYWSTQQRTKGPGHCTEKRDLLTEIYICRPLIT